MMRTMTSASMSSTAASPAAAVLALIPEGVREVVTMHDSVESVMYRLQQLVDVATDPYADFGVEFRRTLAQDVLMEDEWDHANDSNSLRVMDVDEFMFREEVLPSLPVSVRSALTLDDSVDTIVAKMLAI